MFKFYNKNIIKLINNGKITIEGIQFLYNQGICCVCEDGKCSYILENINFESKQIKGEM